MCWWWENWFPLRKISIKVDTTDKSRNYLLSVQHECFLKIVTQLEKNSVNSLKLVVNGHSSITVKLRQNKSIPRLFLQRLLTKYYIRSTLSKMQQQQLLLLMSSRYVHSAISALKLLLTLCYCFCRFTELRNNSHVMFANCNFATRIPWCDISFNIQENVHSVAKTVNRDSLPLIV